MRGPGASPSLAKFWETFTNDSMAGCVACSPFRGSGARSRSTLPTELDLSDERPESTLTGRWRLRRQDRGMRAILLASATATSLKGFFSISFFAHNHGIPTLRCCVRTRSRHSRSPPPIASVVEKFSLLFCSPWKSVQDQFDRRDRAPERIRNHLRSDAGISRLEGYRVSRQRSGPYSLQPAFQVRQVTLASGQGFLNDAARRNVMMPPGSRALLADGLLSPAVVLGRAFLDTPLRTPTGVKRRG